MERVFIANLSEIPELRGRSVTINGTEIALFKLSSGELKAIENRCPHKNGKLSEGIVSGKHVFCPLHDWKINVCDGLVQSPDEGCVRTFELEIDESTGKVYVLFAADKSKSA